MFDGNRPCPPEESGAFRTHITRLIHLHPYATLLSELEGSASAMGLKSNRVLRWARPIVPNQPKEEVS